MGRRLRWSVGQLDAGEQHGLMGEPPEPADLAPRMLSRAAQLAAGYYLDVESRCQTWLVSHDFVATSPLLTAARAEGPSRRGQGSAPAMPGGPQPRRHSLTPTASRVASHRVGRGS